MKAGELLSPKRGKSSLPEQAGLPKVGSERLVQLGEVLRQRYAEIEREPVPERLQKLIDALKDAENRKRADD